MYVYLYSVLSDFAIRVAAMTQWNPRLRIVMRIHTTNSSAIKTDCTTSGSTTSMMNTTGYTPSAIATSATAA